MYASQPPWDIGRPQPAFAGLAPGAIRGRVLDVGCGTGEHTLMAAERGLDATGIDLEEAALRSARYKARDRGLAARFLRHDALRLADLGEVFETVLDSLAGRWDLVSLQPATCSSNYYADGVAGWLAAVTRP